MAKRYKQKIKKRVKNIRRKTSYFKPGDARTIEEFLIASIISGAFIGIGSVIGSVLGKYLVKEFDKTIPLPESLHATISKE